MITVNRYIKIVNILDRAKRSYNWIDSKAECRLYTGEDKINSESNWYTYKDQR